MTLCALLLTIKYFLIHPVVQLAGIPIIKSVASNKSGADVATSYSVNYPHVHTNMFLNLGKWVKIYSSPPHKKCRLYYIHHY